MFPAKFCSCVRKVGRVIWICASSKALPGNKTSVSVISSATHWFNGYGVPALLHTVQHNPNCDGSQLSSAHLVNVVSHVLCMLRFLNTIRRSVIHTKSNNHQIATMCCTPNDCEPLVHQFSSGDIEVRWASDRYRWRRTRRRGTRGRRG